LEKNKFRILVYIPILAVVFLIIGAMALYFILKYSHGEGTAFEIIFIIVSLVGIPLVLFVSSFITMWPCVEFCKKGIEKTLLGKKQRFISWEEIYEIRRINAGITVWIFFSKVSLEGKKITACRLRKDNIFVVSTPDVEQTINRFAPSRLLQK
jgi:hypothetical protein